LSMASIRSQRSTPNARRREPRRSARLHSRRRFAKVKHWLRSSRRYRPPLKYPGSQPKAGSISPS